MLSQLKIIEYNDEKNQTDDIKLYYSKGKYQGDWKGISIIQQVMK